MMSGQVGQDEGEFSGQGVQVPKGAVAEVARGAVRQSVQKHFLGVQVATGPGANLLVEKLADKLTPEHITKVLDSV